MSATYHRKARPIPTDCPKCKHPMARHTEKGCDCGECDRTPTLIAMQRIEQAYGFGWDDGSARR